MLMAIDDWLDVLGQHCFRLDVPGATMGGIAFCLCNRACQTYPDCPDAGAIAESEKLSECLLTEHAFANHEKDYDQTHVTMPCSTRKPMLAEARRFICFANNCPGLAPPADQVHPRQP